MKKFWFNEIRVWVIGALLLVWTLTPIYHMAVMAMTPASEAFAGALWPAHPTLGNFKTTVTQGHHFLGQFWTQLGNSLLVALTVAFLTLLIATLASFAISRLRMKGGRLVTDAALLTYLIPSSFLTIPMYKIITNYGLTNTRVALILGMVTFATPYAIWVLKQSADKIPYELDEAARIDGASPLQIFWMIYLPLLGPSLVAVGAYALLLAWNEYLYALVLLSTEDRLTLPVAMGHFLSSDDAPWNLLMATGIIYAIPPVAMYYAVRHYMVEGLTSGAVKS
ncbi:MAG: carbohydrate transporter permease [Polaromonas sp.]|nr:carbohydrate transporter permease [Polaromonas sp.]MDB5938554.1 carbohydrate transporter permease [Polaromonas sp.]